jgi:hypothetical protein
MTPSPTLQDLIETVRTDATSEDPLEELGQAARTVGEIEEVADSLLGHFVDRCRRSGRSWSEISSVLGVSKQAAHQRFAIPLPTAAPTFERFTERARAVLSDSAGQARGLGHNYVGTEHLLLALFEPPEAIAAQVLHEYGLRHSAVEELVTAGSGRGSTPVAGETPFTPGAIDTLRHAVVEALRLGHNYIGTEHLLLALFDDADSPAAKILAALGMTYDDAMDRIQQKFASLRR